MHESYIVNEGIFLCEEGWKGGRKYKFTLLLYNALENKVRLTFVLSMHSLRVQLSLQKR